MPVKFRKELGKKIIITPGLGQCLFIFTAKEWAKVSKKLSDSDSDLSFLKADQRSFNRYMFGRAAEVETDSIGRILIPEFLQEGIRLRDKAAIIGVKDNSERLSAGLGFGYDAAIHEFNHEQFEHYWKARVNIVSLTLNYRLNTIE